MDNRQICYNPKPLRAEDLKSETLFRPVHHAKPLFLFLFFRAYGQKLTPTLEPIDEYEDPEVLCV